MFSPDFFDVLFHTVGPYLVAVLLAATIVRPFSE